MFYIFWAERWLHKHVFFIIISELYTYDAILFCVCISYVNKTIYRKRKDILFFIFLINM